jgi:kinesin family member 2/24
MNVNEIKLKIDMTKYIETKQFMFDHVFDEKSNTEEVYEKTTKPLIEHLFNENGGNASVLAYGQTYNINKI